jgi:hypothetical protein
MESNGTTPPAAPGHTSTARKSRRYEWKWSARRELAAKLVAADDMPDVKIAAQVGISQRVFYRWKKWPEFQARVNEHREDFRKRVFGSRFCRRENRILIRQQLIDKCLQIIKERAATPGYEKIPGGTTGLVTPRFRVLEGRVVTEYQIDTETEGIIRANLREIAEEVGEWHGRAELGPVDASLAGNQSLVFVVSPTQMQVAGDRILDVEVVSDDDAGSKKVVQAIALPPLPAGT